jgi:hypothetical protein
MNRAAGDRSKPGGELTLPGFGWRRSSLFPDRSVDRINGEQGPWVGRFDN